MAFGEILRSAREQRGLTHSAVAQATNLKVQIVEDLEREDFRRIAAPIYGRGFIRLCAGFLELDHEPLVRDFMELYSGNRPPAVRTSVLTPTKVEPQIREKEVAPVVEAASEVVKVAPVVSSEPVAAAAKSVPEVQRPEPAMVVVEENAAKEEVLETAAESSEDLLLGDEAPVVAHQLEEAAVVAPKDEVVGKLHKAPAVSVLTPNKSKPAVEVPKGERCQVPIFQINGGASLVGGSGGSRLRMALSDAGLWLRERWEDLCDLVMRLWDALPLPRMESWGSRLLGVGLVLMVALMLFGISKLFKMTSQSATVVQVATPGVLESVGSPQDMFVD